MAQSAQLAESSAPLENAATSYAETSPLTSNHCFEEGLFSQEKMSAKNAAGMDAVSERSPAIVDDRPQLTVEKQSSVEKSNAARQSQTSYVSQKPCPTDEELAALRAEAEAKKLLKRQLQQIERGVIPQEIATKPFNEMVNEIKVLLYKTGKFPSENIELFLKKVCQHPNTLLNNQKIPLNLETYLVYGSKAPKYNLKHICEGEIRNGKPKGFHHKPSAPEQIIEVVVPPNKHGVYRAKCKIKGSSYEKISNMFPDTWSCEKVEKKILEAFNNVIEEQSMGRVGITSEGIKIEMWFMKNKVTQEIIMDTAYPLMA